LFRSDGRPTFVFKTKRVLEVEAEKGDF